MNELESILEYATDELRLIFDAFDSEILNRISEIRIRRNKKLVVVIKNTSYFVDYKGDIYDYPAENAVTINDKAFNDIFLSFCEYSIYSNMNSLKEGYITLPNGARIGAASTAVYEGNTIEAVKDITSLNIRIPREVKGCSENILNFLYVNSFPSIIVAGKPNSGKTTLLRDLARSLSNGFNGRCAKISIIDERNEFAGKKNENHILDVGENTDVLTGFSKSKGIEIATRTLSPEMIICDEISTPEEAEAIKFAFSSGVAFALSVHINSRKDFADKPIVKELLKTNEFDYIVLLDNYKYQTDIIEAEAVYNEILRNDNVNSLLNNLGISII